METNETKRITRERLERLLISSGFPADEARALAAEGVVRHSEEVESVLDFLKSLQRANLH